MEQKMESFLDSFLDQIASALYSFGILIGILFVLSGIILVWRKKKKKYAVLCIGIGVISIVSGFLQGGF